MINNADIKNIFKYFNDEEVETEVIEKLRQKLELIVEQIKVQEEFNKSMEEIAEKFDKIK